MSRVKAKQKSNGQRVKSKQPKQKPFNPIAARLGLTSKNRAILDSK